MGKVHIELFEFGLFINHPKVLAVVFPAPSHVLLIEQDVKVIANGVSTTERETMAVDRGATLELLGPGGAPLPEGKPTEVDYRKFVVDVDKATGAALNVPADLYDPDAPLDAARFNGRLFLRGGTIVGKECSIPENRGLFDFGGGQFLVTDTAVFEMAVPDGLPAVLRVNDASIEIPDGTSIRINNRDSLGGRSSGFSELEEFVHLCSALGLAVPLPKPLGGAIGAMGGNSVCALAQVEGD